MPFFQDILIPKSFPLSRWKDFASHPILHNLSPKILKKENYAFVLVAWTTLQGSYKKKKS